MKPVMLLLALAAAALAQEVDLAAVTSNKLDRPLGFGIGKAESVRTAFMRALTGAEVHGGIELVEDCSSRWATISLRPGASAREILNQIIAVRPDLSMEISKDGMVHILPRAGGNEILDVRLHKVDIPDRQNLVFAIELIENAPEYRARLKTTHVRREALRQLSLLSSGPKAGSPRVEPIPMTLSGVTVREALDQLGAPSKSAVWVYYEHTCSGNGSFR